MTDESIRVVELNYYPVKSYRGIAVGAARVGARGFELDREWVVVDPTGKFLTQREIPAMSLIDVTVITSERGGHTPRLSAAGREPLEIDASASNGSESEELEVKVWDDKCLGYDEGPEPAGWLSDCLGRDVRLVRMAPDHVRAVEPKGDFSGDAQVGFADGFPFLIISEEPLSELNNRLDQPVPMNRFRPNIVLGGCRPFAEDEWRRIRIGEIEFVIDSPCARCVITTIDQATGKKTGEPLRALATFRKQDNKVMFGQNAIHLGTGDIKCGDRVKVLD